MRPYRFIDHMADGGIEIFGSDVKTLFSNAAAGLFDMITDRSRIKGKEVKTVGISGEDWADLMVNWLRELLYLWHVKEWLVETVRISEISTRKLTARIKYDRFDPDRHALKTEIKAVTYHQVRVARQMDRWEARVIFDL